jgi:carbamoyl-phosphate synthase large subunit
VPIISKATGTNLVAAATRVALGEKLADMPYGTGLLPDAPFVVVKVPVFSFAKMRGVETILGPEMKSTGEVLGIDATFAGALRKGFIAAGIRVPAPAADGANGGRILVSISDEDKDEATPILRDYADLGYTLVATPGTHAHLVANGIRSERVNKIADGSPNVLDLIVSRSVDLIINAASPRDQNDGYRIRRAAVESSVACITSLDTARALAEALGSESGPPRSLQDYRAAVGAK